MAVDRLANLAEQCDFCGAVNPATAKVCSGCGANREHLAAASIAYRDRQIEELQEQQVRLEREHADAKALEMEHGRRHLLTQLAVASVLVVLVAGAVFGLGSYRIEQERIRQQQLAALAAAAEQCVQSRDLRCGRDRYLALLDQEPGYPGASAALAQARLGLALELADRRQWQEALDEVDGALKADPKNTDARLLGRTVIDRWIAQTITDGDWLTFLRLRVERDRRYPSGGAT